MHAWGSPIPKASPLAPRGLCAHAPVGGPARVHAAFRRLLPSRRCVVLVNGFYEWKKEGAVKQPYYVHCGGDGVLRMAALYDTYTGVGTKTLPSWRAPYHASADKYISDISFYGMPRPCR